MNAHLHISKPWIYLGGATALVLGLMACVHSKPDRPLRTAKAVDIQRYAGHWHEQFRLPNSFQKDGAKAEAEYSLLPDGKVRVVNTETRPDGKKNIATGTAIAVPGSNNSRLRVKFDGLASLVPAAESGNYWIIQVEPDYSAALVGTPDRKFLWMLSRKDPVSPALRDRYVSTAKELGFDTSRLLFRGQ